jgi:SAM-dependent methyltransferase
LVIVTGHVNRLVTPGARAGLSALAEGVTVASVGASLRIGRAGLSVQASGSSPNLPRPVDVVLVVDTYHHLPNRPAYFRELQKSLSPGGRLALIDFRKDSPDGPPAELRFDASQIIGEMKQANYQLDGNVDFLLRQHFLVFRPATAGR